MPKTTSLTKPAGVALQLIGAALTINGIIFLFISLGGFGVVEAIVISVLSLAVGIWLLVIDRRPAVLPREKDVTKACPDCAEIIKADAKVCLYCGHQFN